MSRRLATKAQGCPQVHRRDPYKNPGACGPCGQPSDLTLNTVAFPGPLAESQGHVSYLLFHPAPFFRAQPPHPTIGGCA